MAFSTVQTWLVAGVISIVIYILARSEGARTFGRSLIPQQRLLAIAWYIHVYTTPIRTEVDNNKRRLIAIEAKLEEIHQEIRQEAAHRQDLVNRIEEVRRIVNEVSNYYWNSEDEINQEDQQEPAVQSWNNNNWNTEENNNNNALDWEPWPATTERDNRWARQPTNDDWPEPNNNTGWPETITEEPYRDFNGDENYRHPDSPDSIPGLLYYNQEQRQEAGELVSQQPLLVSNIELSNLDDVVRSNSSSTRGNYSGSSTTTREPGVHTVDSLFFEFKDNLSDTSSDSNKTSNKDTDSQESDEESSEEELLIDLK